MKILITGGSGFIARNIFEQLQSKYEITAVGSRELDLLDPDRVYDYFLKNDFDVVIHTATYDAAPKHSVKDPAKVLENNLKMFFNLVRAKKHFGKMIYFGSGAEFGRDFWKPKMEEGYFDSHVPSDQYGFSKYLMTKYVLLSKGIYNLRLFGVFGKYDDWRTRVIPNICYLAITNQEIVIEQNKIYDFLYIDDLVKIVDWFIRNEPKRKIYNVCSGTAIDFKSIGEQLIKISKKDLTLKIKTDDLGREYSGNNKSLLSELRDFKFTPINESLRFLYEWYDVNKNIFNEVV